MRKALLGLVVLFALQSQAQLPKELEPIMTRYFVSLARNNNLNEWLYELKKNQNIQPDTSYLLDPSHRTLFSGYLLRPLEKMKIADSTYIKLISHSKSFDVKINDTMQIKQIVYADLHQIFYINKNKVTQAGIKEIVKDIKKEFVKYFHSKEVKHGSYLTVFLTPNYENVPTILLSYRMDDKKTDFHTIWLTIQFSEVKS